jgi:predicted histidine transporter YuiF (NhaC family)
VASPSAGPAEEALRSVESAQAVRTGADPMVLVGRMDATLLAVLMGARLFLLLTAAPTDGIGRGFGRIPVINILYSYFKLFHGLDSCDC